MYDVLTWVHRNNAGMSLNYRVIEFSMLCISFDPYLKNALSNAFNYWVENWVIYCMIGLTNTELCQNWLLILLNREFKQKHNFNFYL
jgi:hypothetical protein